MEQQQWLPATSLLAGLRFPTGGRAVTSDGYDPFGKLIASWQLGERFSLDTNLGVAAPTQGVADAGRVYELFAAASLGVSLTEWTGAFLEYDATVRGRGEHDEQALDGGFTYLLTNNVQLDISGGAGLNRAAPDFFVGAGIAWRFWSPRVEVERDSLEGYGSPTGRRSTRVEPITITPWVTNKSQKGSRSL